MKRKGIKIFDLETWTDEVLDPIENVWIETESGAPRIQVSGSTPLLQNKRKEIIHFIKENFATLLEFQEMTLEYARMFEYEWPTVYPVIVKAAGELNDRAYINARVFWPMAGKKKKELRFYICPYTEGMDIKSDAFMFMVRQKVGVELQKRFYNTGFTEPNTAEKINRNNRIYDRLSNALK